MGFEGELFSGKPDWNEAAAQPKPRAERARSRPSSTARCEELCAMLDDWQITHELADLPPERLGVHQEEQVLRHDHPQAVRRPGVFRAGAFGGAAEAVHACRRRCRPRSPCPTRSGRPSCCCTTAATSRRTTTCRASPMGEEIPCFALTGPYAGSDATSIPDYGIVCKQVVDGVETLGIKLTFDKRYITLAPVATVVGPGVPHVRPGAPAGRQGGPRHHAGAAAALNAGAAKSAVAISRSTSRSRTGRCMARTCSCRCRP